MRVQVPGSGRIATIARQPGDCGRREHPGGTQNACRVREGVWLRRCEKRDEVCTLLCSCGNLEPATSVFGDDDLDASRTSLRTLGGYVVRELDLDSNEQWLVCCPFKSSLRNRTTNGAKGEPFGFGYYRLVIPDLLLLILTPIYDLQSPK